MKLGEKIRGYTVVTNPTNQSGGKCLWAFAERGGQDYFLKQFLDPKWPLDSSPGNERSKAARRAICREFERRHRLVMERLKDNVPGGGNIVVAHDFFREGGTYYKVTERIDPANLGNMAELTPQQQAVVLRTLALSIQQLHRIGVVHGDLKPANVLVQRRPGSEFYTAKLIDFDDSYVAGEAPGRTEIGGDLAYGPPEWHRYIGNDESVSGSDLTTAVDMFGLGLIMHEYIVGERIGFDTDRFEAPGAAAGAGRPLVPSPKLGRYLRDLVVALTDADAARRPDVGAFLSALDDTDVFDPAKAAWSSGFRGGPVPKATTAPGRPGPADRTDRPPPGTGLRRWVFNTGPATKPPIVPNAKSSVPPPPAEPETKTARERTAPPKGASRVRINFTKPRAETGRGDTDDE